MSDKLIIAAVALGSVAIIALIAKGDKVVKAAGETVGGVVTGNNAVTEGTAYAGKGVLGTVGGTLDAAAGGLFSDIGGWLGGVAYDAFGNDVDPTAPAPLPVPSTAQ